MISVINKTEYDTDKQNFVEKIEDVQKRISSTDCNTKITEIERKILDVTGLIKKTNIDTKLRKNKKKTIREWLKKNQIKNNKGVT